jgi:hypothetical protein
MHTCTPTPPPQTQAPHELNGEARRTMLLLLLLLLMLLREGGVREGEQGVLRVDGGYA